MNKNTNGKDIYDCIVIGAGASGLFYAASDRKSGKKLIIEKTGRPGQKLLMSGNGMCNITHGGSIKDFIDRYDDNGRKIRSCLYRHSNLELMDMMESLGVPLTEREDGKVFPASMKAKDVLDALLKAAQMNGWEMRCGEEVTAIEGNKTVLSDGTSLEAKKLVICTGGASYPLTGSDGTFYEVLERDLALNISAPRPALAPVFVQDFSYSELSGISFEDALVSSGKHKVRGPVLITHKGFSGPAILHISQYVHAGDELRIDYLPDMDKRDVALKIKSDQPGSRTGAANYISNTFSLPKAFVCERLKSIGLDTKLSSLTGHDIVSIASALTDHTYSVSGTGGWNEAMVTKGGVALDQIDLKTMKIKGLPEERDIRIIGEALDVNGDTGGYNLQFAYSSAMTALD